MIHAYRTDDSHNCVNRICANHLAFLALTQTLTLALALTYDVGRHCTTALAHISRLPIRNINSRD